MRIISPTGLPRRAGRGWATGSTITVFLLVLFLTASHLTLAGTFNFSNTANIAIPGSGATGSGPASPYPAPITVTGVSGNVTKVTVTLSRFKHTYSRDVDVLLVSPDDKKVQLMSFTGLGPTGGNTASEVTLTLDDSAANPLPPSSALSTGTYKPTVYPTVPARGDLPSPAPTGPYSTTLSAFNGSPANGVWKLYVTDRTNGDTGSIAGGWSLNIVTPNSAPTGLSLNPNPASVVENSPFGTVVGTFSTTDPDPGDSFTYTLTDSAGGRFRISGNQLQVNNGGLLDYETTTSHTVVVKVTDAGGLFLDNQSFTVNVTNVNEPPASLTLTGNSVPENSATGTLIGTFSSTDPDAGGTYTYSLVDSAGGRFKVAGGNQLQVDNSALLNYESGSSYSIVARVSDQGGLFYNNTFTVNVTNVNEPPTAINLSSNTVRENSANNTLIGTFSTVDPDSGEAFSYTLLDDAGGRFVLAGAGSRDLRVADGSLLNYEVAASHTIKVKVTDSASNVLDNQSLTIQVLNVNEPPVITPAATPAPVRQGTNRVITGLALADPDVGNNNLEVSLTAGNGVLSLGSLTGLTFSGGSDGTQDAAMTFRGKLTDLNAALASVTYRSDPTYDGTEVVTLSVNDLGSTGLNGPQTTNATVNVVVKAPPTITVQPSNQNVPVGTAANLSVSVVGTAPFSYQWYIGTSGNTANPVGGATSASFNTGPVNATTSYWVRVTNDVGVVNGNPDIGVADSQTAVVIAGSVLDISIEATVNLSSPLVGQDIVYTLKATNKSQTAASGVKVSDVLPANVSFISANPAAAYNKTTGLWTVGSLDAGTTATLELTARPTQGGSYTNTASLVALDQTDSDSTNNASSVGIVASGTTILVTEPNDDGTGGSGTLSAAITAANAGPNRVIHFALNGGGSTVTLSGTTLLPEVGQNVVIEGTSCANRITINGNGRPGNGLTLGGSTALRYLIITGFGGKELVAKTTHGKNTLSCVSIRQSLAANSLSN